MSNNINLLNLIINGGEGSGWFNPDHAARKAGQRCKIAADFVGRGERLASAVAQVDYIQESIYNEMNTVHTSSPTTTKTWCSIQEEIHSNRPEGADVTTVKKSPDGKKDLEIKGRSDNDKLNEIDQVLQDYTSIASDLTYYATQRDQDFIPRNLSHLKRDLEKTRRGIQSVSRNSDGSYFVLRDSAGKEQPMAKALTTIYDDLSAYIKSI